MVAGPVVDRSDHGHPRGGLACGRELLGARTHRDRSQRNLESNRNQRHGRPDVRHPTVHPGGPDTALPVALRWRGGARNWDGIDCIIHC